MATCQIEQEGLCSEESENLCYMSSIQSVSLPWVAKGVEGDRPD